MAGLYTDAFLEELRAHAAALAPQWGLSPATTASLLNISENATFRLDDPEAAHVIDADGNEVVEVTVTAVAAVPLKETVDDGVKLVPVMRTWPPGAPPGGSIRVMVGAGSTTLKTPLAEVLTPGDRTTAS